MKVSSVLHPFFLLVVNLALLFISADAVFCRENGNSVLPLSAAEDQALENNPSLQEIQARIASSRARSISAAELPDPQLTLGLINLPVDTFDLDQEPMTQTVIGVSQTLPFPGKLQLKGDIQSKQSEVWQWRHLDLRAELIRQVRDSWLQSFFLSRSLEVIEANLDLFEELVTVARKQYVVGRGLQQDVLLAQTELDRIVDEKIRIEDQIYQEKSRLIELTAATHPDFTMPDRLPKLKNPPGYEKLLNLLAQHPTVRAREAMIEKLQTSVELARKAFYPDFRVNFSYGHRRAREMDGNRLADFTSASVMFDLPIFTEDRQEKELAAVRSEERAAARQKEALLLKLKHQARSRWSMLRKTVKRTEMYEEIILPESRQTIQSSMAAYVAGELDFLELVRARLKHLQNELTLWRLKVEAEKAGSDLLYLAAGRGEQK